MKCTPARICQLLFLALFLVLFVQTEYRGHDEINAAVNSFFRVNPLVLFSYLLASKTWTWLLFPAVLMVIATLFLGRFFCGWICPLGTILDLVTVRISKTTPIQWLKGNTKYWLLVPLLAAALFNINLSGLLDPIAILLRGMTFFLYPVLGMAAREGWVGLYQVIGEQRDAVSPAYGLIRDNVLPFRDTMYPLAFFSAAILLGVIALERFETRTWCRNLCPLGTLLGLLSRFSPFERAPGVVCGDCGRCREVCPTGFETGVLLKDECTRCMECQRECPHGRVVFQPLLQMKSSRPFLPERRVLLGGIAGGLMLAVPARFRSPERESRLLRPPGVRDEDDFLKKCVRCGECMKVCLKNALYPAGFRAGLEGLYTPQVIPRLGYCEYNCTLCGQVCPTGAIPLLPVEEKRRAVIGKAVFDKNHCLPFARKIDCIVCEEHCPVPDKAIRSRSTSVIGLDGQPRIVKEPYLVEEICNGCGICENVCPLETKAGVEVFTVKSRDPIPRHVGGQGETPYGTRF